MRNEGGSKTAAGKVGNAMWVKRSGVSSDTALFALASVCIGTMNEDELVALMKGIWRDTVYRSYIYIGRFSRWKSSVD